MAKTKSDPDATARNAFLAEIRMQRARFDLPQSALAQHLDLGDSRMSVLLSNPDSLSAGRLRKLVQMLHLDPVVILEFLGYTRKEIKVLAQAMGEKEAVS